MLFQVISPPANPITTSVSTPVTPIRIPVNESTPSVTQMPPKIKESSSVDDSSVAPVEQILIGETNQPQIGDDPLETEMDPLDISDLNEQNQSQNISSEDESDNSKSDKRRNKSGLLGYQLYRCAFCDFSCSNVTDFKKHVAKSLLCRSGESFAKPFVCVHCRKKLRNPAALLDHIQTHGVLKFMCSLCEEKFATGYKAR